MARDFESGAVESQTLTNVEYIPVPADEMSEDLEEISLEEKDVLEAADEISLGEASPLGSELEMPLVPSRPPPLWVRCVKVVFWALVPSFLHPTDPRKAVKPLHPTAWLDGLRGVAAFLVVCHHWSLLNFSMRIHKGFGSDAQPLVIQLPIIRLLVSGYWAVCVFFVISGFALSLKPMKLLSQKRRADFAAAAASAVLRRWIRIFLPPAVTTFVVACMAHAGWFEVQTNPAASGLPRLRPALAGSFLGQVHDWWSHTVVFAEPLSTNMWRGGLYAYDAVLWTIPVEFSCSLVLFLAHVAFSRLRPNARSFAHVSLTSWALYLNRWEIFLFCAGLCCADLQARMLQKPCTGDSPDDCLAEQDTLPLWSRPLRRDSFSRLQSAVSSSPAWSTCKKTAAFVSFTTALYLLSYPRLLLDAAATPGYRALAAATPAQYDNGWSLWISLGAVLLVLTVQASPELQSLFTHPLTQYLGRVSFALYLVHNPMLWVCGWHLVRFFADFTGVATEGQRGLAIFFGTCFFFPALFCVADFAQRYVDAKAVSFAAWFERKVIEKVE
ncbi:hard surface induced protein [Colletotrichum sojae]|uniref:Hard surface induced protein n=1 Tax=Colletotrichum sojae TaxID=2175907 RepID=A0A8H6J2X6_9PEZI|nr:hard surface induced protein [Colletotrichum sojae]